MVPKIQSKSIKNLYFCSWASFGETLARFGTNLVSFRCLLDDLGLRFSCFSISIVYPPNQTLGASFNVENDQRIKAHLSRWFPAILKKHIIFGLAFFASVFRLFTHQTRHLVLSFNMENDQRIEARLLRWFPAILYKYMIFGLAFLASVFRPFTYQTRHLVSSFNMENDQRIKAHLLRWFPAMFEKILIFGFSVFDSQPSIFQSK